jgi:diacylglycerol kinase family enzyme
MNKTKNKSIILINTESTDSIKAISYCKKEKLNYYICKTKQEMSTIINTKLDEGIFNFYICGGDGTINSFVNVYMKLPKHKKKNIILGILPCGRANDLAKELSISSDINVTYKQASQNRIK